MVDERLGTARLHHLVVDIASHLHRDHNEALLVPQENQCNIISGGFVVDNNPFDRGPSCAKASGALPDDILLFDSKRSPTFLVPWIVVTHLLVGFVNQKWPSMITNFKLVEVN